MEDIKRECGLTISNLAEGIYNLPDNEFYDFCCEFMKLHEQDDYNPETWIDKLAEFIRESLHEIKDLKEEEKIYE